MSTAIEDTIDKLGKGIFVNCYMEIIIFTGIQATGKSEFFKRRFYNTHVRINLDMLKTRNRENILVNACLEAKQPIVVDNTNPTVADRKKYIDAAKSKGFKVIGYYFSSGIGEAIERNEKRERKVPAAAIRSTHSNLELPAFSEGFDELYYVKIEDNDFIVEEYRDEI